MKLYRTTAISPGGNEYVKYSKNKNQYFGTKGAFHSRCNPYYRDWKVVLDEVEIPDDAWVRVEEA